MKYGPVSEIDIIIAEAIEDAPPGKESTWILRRLGHDLDLTDRQTELLAPLFEEKINDIIRRASIYFSVVSGGYPEFISSLKGALENERRLNDNGPEG